MIKESPKKCLAFLHIDVSKRNLTKQDPTNHPCEPFNQNKNVGKFYIQLGFVIGSCLRKHPYMKWLLRGARKLSGLSHHLDPLLGLRGPNLDKGTD